MSLRNFVAMAILAALPAAMSAPALAQDMQIVFRRLRPGEGWRDAGRHGEAHQAHAACLRAFSDTSSIVQKYQLQEADFDIIGRPKQ